MPARERSLQLLSAGAAQGLVASLAEDFRADTGARIDGTFRALRAVRRAVEAEPPSELDVPRPAAPASERDEIYRGLRDDLVFSHRSQQYFEAILWPRLLNLAGGDLPQPREARRTRRRGPSLHALEALIAEAEKRS